MTGFVSTVLEAWDELRIHKVRVLLALIGVACAVTAITGTTAAVKIFGQAMQEQTERDQGRDTTLLGWTGGPETASLSVADADAAVDDVAARHDISYYSPAAWLMLSVGRSGESIDAQAVDPDYGTITRLEVTDGRWFTEQDADRLAPVLVVNQPFLDAYTGGASASSRPQVVFDAGDDGAVAATVIGETPVRWNDEGPQAYLLFDHAVRWFPDGVSPGEYRFWVPPELADEIRQVLVRDLAAEGVTLQFEPLYTEPFAMDRVEFYLVLGVGGFALLLGGLGLLNIALVTVRYRIREIGIRRSFGATSGRVFFGVLMESVVATTVAGIIGVVIAVAVVKNIPIEQVFGRPLQDLPGFPFEAALIGMACAVGIGALAGLIPAIYAVRVKVIDAIRY